MVADPEPQLVGYRFLALLDDRVDELLDAAALLTDDMVVMTAVIEFEHGAPALKIMALDEACGLELGQDPVYRGEPDVLAGLQQRPIDLFRREVEIRIRLEDVEDLDPRKGHLESGFSELFAFQECVPCGWGEDFRANASCYYYGVRPQPPLPMSTSSSLQRLIVLAVAAVLVLASLSGCARMRNFSLKPYKINIQQGNFLDQEDIDQIEPGMTRSQVRFLLGTPMVADIFNENRWDYVYYLKVGRTGEIFRRHFIVYFEGDEAVRVEKRVDTVPSRQG